MRILLIGGTGFIGSHVCDALLQAGHDIRVYSRQPESFRAPLPGVDYVAGDVADRFALSEALIGVDCVIHLVSSTVPGTSNIDPVADISTNLAPTVGLLELMRQTGTSKLVFLSSGGTVYGNPDAVPVLETHPLRPRCSYAVVKIAIEHYLAMYQSLYGIQTVILRAANPYGPRQGRLHVQGLIASFLSRVMKGQPLEVWGDGETVRDYLYVSDLANLIVRVVESDVSGTYNAGSGIGVSINEIIEVIRRVTGYSPEVKYLAERKFDIKKIYLDINTVRNIFSWQPQVALPEGVARHWDWIKQQKAHQQTSEEPEE